MKKNFENVTKENVSEVTKVIATLIKPGVIIFLDGDPGAGKTYLISEILRKHNILEVTSPTFAIHHKYEMPINIDYKIDHLVDAQLEGRKLIFHHFDLYRIESVDELETVGLWESLGASACFLIEWGAKFPATIWPLNHKKIWIKISDGAISGNSQSTRNYDITAEF